MLLGSDCNCVLQIIVSNISQWHIFCLLKKFFLKKNWCTVIISWGLHLRENKFICYIACPEFLPHNGVDVSFMLTHRWSKFHCESLQYKSSINILRIIWFFLLMSALNILRPILLHPTKWSVCTRNKITKISFKIKLKCEA